MNEPLNLRDAEAVADVFHQAAGALRASPLRNGSIVRLPARGRLLATGDLHDNPAHLGKLLTLARLEQSPDHHVVLHEIIHGEQLINGMDFSHRMLARVAALALRYPGQVHLLLANHELAQMTGRHVSKGAGDSVAMFNDALEYAFGDEAGTVADAIGDFIAAMPLALASDSGVFCAHSLPAPAMMKRFDPTIIRRELQAADYQPPDGSAHLMVWGRGHTGAQIEALAQTWSVRLFVIGHEHVASGIEANGARLIVLNTDHERARVLPIDLTSDPPSPEAALLSAVPLAALA